MPVKYSICYESFFQLDIQDTQQPFPKVVNLDVC